MDCIQSVSAFFKKSPLRPHHTLLLACSGGVDSMVLLHLLLQLDYKPVLAHCNFNLRGGESDADQLFVENLAGKNGLLLHTKSFNTNAYAAEKNISTQMAARDLRYGFFRELIQNQGYTYLLTAHHQDDSLETLLINLGRGTGFTGLQGITHTQPSTLRPLHTLSRQDIMEYAKKNNVSWREDSSNQNAHYQRNFIRHHVIPALKKAFPNFDSGFRTSLENLQQDGAFFQHALQSELDHLIEKQKDSEIIVISKIKGSFFQKTLLNAWLSPVGIFDLEAIIRSFDQESGAMFHSAGHTLLKDREHLILKKNKPESDGKYSIHETDHQIDEPVSMAISLRRNDTFEFPVSPKQAALDLDRLDFPLVLRHWENGDCFKPLGMKGFKKLSDYFTDIKLNRFEKDEVWLLCSGSDIVWVVGHRIDDRFKVSDKTKTIYFVDLLN